MLPYGRLTSNLTCGIRNELHHLKIMEELGGDEKFGDRFIAQHIAFAYYWLVVAVYVTSPAVAYDLNKHVERHAFNTYSEFLVRNEARLRAAPAPQVAKDYYTEANLYMFDAFHSATLSPAASTPFTPRRPSTWAPSHTILPTCHRHCD